METIKTAAIAFGVIAALGILSGIYVELLEIRSRLLSIREDIVDSRCKGIKLEEEKENG